MKAVWLENRELRLRDDAPAPTAPDEEVLVRVLVAGICNTDIELTRGYYPFTGVPGHEFVGVLEDGTRVVGEINAVCHRCDSCLQGRPTHCQQRTVLGIKGRHGAFAEWLSLPRENLHVVPNELSNEQAVFTEPLAAALHIQTQVRIRPEERVLVVGDGKLGQLVAQTLALTGCQLMVAGRHEQKLSLLRKRGIDTTKQIPDEKFDVVVECTGDAQGFRSARAAVRPRGTLVMKSTFAGEVSLNLSSLVVDEITLVGSRCGPFAPALQLLRDGSVDVRPLIHASYPLRDALDAFAEAQRPGVLKVLIQIEN